MASTDRCFSPASTPFLTAFAAATRAYGRGLCWLSIGSMPPFPTRASIIGEARSWPDSACEASLPTQKPTKPDDREEPQTSPGVEKTVLWHDQRRTGLWTPARHEPRWLFPIVPDVSRHQRDDDRQPKQPWPRRINPQRLVSELWPWSAAIGSGFIGVRQDRLSRPPRKAIVVCAGGKAIIACARDGCVVRAAAASVRDTYVRPPRVDAALEGRVTIQAACRVRCRQGVGLWCGGGP